jgi:hypothetical protein
VRVAGPILTFSLRGRGIDPIPFLGWARWKSAALKSTRLNKITLIENCSRAFILGHAHAFGFMDTYIDASLLNLYPEREGT